MAPDKELGAWLAQERDDIGMSQAEAARRVGISASQLSAIEAGESGTSVPTLRMLAEVLGLKRSDVLLRAGKDRDAAWDLLSEQRAEAAARPSPEPQTLAQLVHRMAELVDAGEGQSQDEKPAPMPQPTGEGRRRPPPGSKRTRRTDTRGTA